MGSYYYCYNHSIHVVDNAKTHTAKEFSLDEFGMKPGMRCPVDQIQYIDDYGQQKTIQCYFTSGPLKEKSKGLLKIAKELEISLHDNVKLKELKVLSKHQDFQNVRKSLISVFNIIASPFNTIFSDQNWKKSLSNIILKLHSLLNFIVSSTALRGYEPTKNNSFDSKLIKRSRRWSILLQIRESILSKEMLQSSFFKRFWHTLVAYDGGDTYEEVFTMYFSSLCRDTIRQHRQITNSNIE